MHNIVSVDSPLNPAILPPNLARMIRTFSFFLFVAAAFRLVAIEDLKISVSSTNAVLSWPSKAGETYVVQYSARLDSTMSWATLTNGMPPASGTNRTTFVHAGIAVGSVQESGGPGPIGSPSAQVVTTSTTSTLLRHRSRVPLPPSPMDSQNVVSVSAQNMASVSTFSVIPTPQGALGFYRVVRSGVTILGLTNNQTAKGTISFKVEIGLPDYGTSSGVIVTDADSGASIPGLAVSANSDGYSFTWNTILTTNRLYHLKATAVTGDIAPFSEVDSATLAVTVSNSIWIPDSYNTAGYLLTVDAQTTYHNGACRVEVYRDPTMFGSNLWFYALGTTDSQGYLTFTYQDGSHGRGFTYPLYDNQGNMLPGNQYLVVIKTAQTSAGLAAPPAKVTNQVPVEMPWPSTNDIRTKYSIAYMPVFGDPANGIFNALVVDSMIQSVYVAAQTRDGGLGVATGSDQDTYKLWNDGDFRVWLTKDLHSPTVRNLFYWGHAAPNQLGTSAATSPAGKLDLSNFDTVLRNRLGAGSTNGHPFRFVFLFGCETANGNLCEAFGIPKREHMTRRDFWNKGLRPRAFIGLKSKQIAGFAGLPNTQELTFIGNFFSHWALDKTNNANIGIRQALSVCNPLGADYWSGASDIVVFGAEDLTFYDIDDNP